jgi:hypothetical protein
VKTGLKNEVNKYIFFLFFLLNYNLSAQISLNGFGKYNKYETPAGYQNLITLNYNNDAYTDLLLLSPSKKQLSLLEGDNTGSFSRNSNFNFRYPVSAIKNLSIDNRYYRSYVTVSRRSRTASVINFNEDGLYILDEMKFDSYPERTDVSDITLDQSPDLLISGSGFDGLSILHIRNGKITESKVVEKGAFRDAVFTDFNNDRYPDITAINIYDQSIDFYNNNTRGRFTLSKSVPLNKIPFAIYSTDIDLDYFEDIIWNVKEGITILYGDENASYENSVFINTLYVPHIIITGDFNRDGNIDLAYADTLSGAVSVFFADEERNFSGEHLLFIKQNVISLVPFYSKFISGLAAYSSDGYIYTVTQLLSFSDDVSLIAGIKPGAVDYFDYQNNGINDIVYIDEGDESLNLLVRNNSGIPDKFFKHKLHLPHKEILIDNYSREVKIFYCWTRGEKLIEIITADLAENRLSRSSLYTTEKIHDLKIKPVRGKPAVIYAAYINKKTAGVNVFEFYDFRYIRGDYNAFALDVEDISPFITGKDEGFFTWQKRNSLDLYYHNMRNLAEFRKMGEVVSGEEIITFTADIFNSDSPAQLAYLKGNGFYSVTASGIIKINSGKVPVISGKHQFWAGTVRTGGLKRVFIYLPEKKSLERITLFNRGKNLILSELISGITVNRFFVKNMGTINYHVVYSDSEENCITIKRIK